MLTKLRVLSIEDNPDHAMLIRMALESLDVELECHPSAESALQAAMPPDLVLADVKLPGLSGIDLISHCRAQFGPVPVVMLSTSEDPQDIVRSFEAGAAGYITKVAGISALQHKLAQVIDYWCNVSERPARDATQNR